MMIVNPQLPTPNSQPARWRAIIAAALAILCLAAAPLLFTLLLLPAAPTAAQEAPSGPIRWKKTVIDRTFRSEGVAVAV